MSDRLFYAFWPEEALRQEIAGRIDGWLHDYPCKPQRPDQFHLTVEFLGPVPPDRQPALHEAGRALEGSLEAPESLVLDRLEHWRKPGVICVTGDQVPSGTCAMIDALGRELSQRGFSPETRPFRPHLTLARKARRPFTGRPVDPLRWPVSNLWLVRSITDPAGSRYEPFASWNLVRTLTPALSR